LYAILSLCSEDVAFDSIPFLLTAFVLTLPNIVEELLDVLRSVHFALFGGRRGTGAP
jgi:hypothetical protein